MRARSYYVRIAGNDYSVDPAAIGRMVAAQADLDRPDELDGRLVGEHPRVWARGPTVTDTAHVAAARQLRHQFQQPRPRPVADDLMRDLADYDKAFGITSEGDVWWLPRPMRPSSS